MENLTNIYKNHRDLYDKLLEYNCILSKNGKTIYEGKLADAELNDNENCSKVVCKIVLENGKTFICTVFENKAIKTMFDILGNKSLDEALNDYKLYNKLYNISYDLPVLDIFDESVKLSRKDNNYKILAENYSYNI